MKRFQGVRHPATANPEVLPESSGVIYLEQELCEKAAVGVIDIGGLNVNCCVYNKTVPVLSVIRNFTYSLISQNSSNKNKVQHNSF